MEAGVAATQARGQHGAPAAPPGWELRLLFDGDCPLCVREVDMLKARDAGKGKIDFVDIAAEDYDAAANAGIEFETAMERIHGILPDNTVVRDVEVFRRAYEAVGLGWVYAATRWEPVARAADAVYGVWARNRMQVTGRPPLAEVLELRRRRLAGEACDVDGECRVG